MKAFKILFVDDDKDILFIVEKFLSRQGYNVTVADNGIEALELVKQKNFDIVFTDFKMPEFDGLELLAAIKEYRPETEVVIVTGYGTMESAVKAMKFGSYDYIQKPFKLDSLKALIDRVIEEKRFRDQNIILKRRIKDGQRHRYDELVGMSLKMQEVYETIDRVSMSNLFVMIRGESGTGKELAARVIHNRSNRHNKPFVPVNCSSVDEGIPESRLFDHIVGLLEMSKGGTIYLDEVSDITPTLQLKLLQVLKEKRLGLEETSKESAIDARVISASKADLEEAIKNGEIRKDLFDLLNGAKIIMPPLRERKEDICLLLNHFLYQFNKKTPRKIGSVSPQTMDILLDYHWPGNIIQFHSVIERAFATGVEGTIEPDDLPKEIRTFGEASKKKRLH
ncbi:Two component, sigma54 specific, transcriptional regulator, Fis family [uncultured Desulfobacterium sp.]|uniref:Two component, sigma54 specific, transcriptional regulator, Fis family n=1 Tax=uncultured Desulfobacterium sp. TaxID=201089 RepID=A0A445MZ98_9BACT|nr:Two component, sigma54 specific, transcriptional regulator, Fis family [uncultured Desulfobacterium sp.]